MTKNKIKKTKISATSLKKIPEQEKDYLAAILEEMRSDFRAFGESLEFVREKGDATFEEVGRIKVEIEEINFRLDNIDGRLDNIDGRLNNIEKEVVSIRNDINFWKATLTQKADVEFLEKLEARLVRVEHHLRLA